MTGPYCPDLPQRKILFNISILTDVLDDENGAKNIPSYVTQITGPERAGV